MKKFLFLLLLLIIPAFCWGDAALIGEADRNVVDSGSFLVGDDTVYSDSTKTFDSDVLSGYHTAFVATGTGDISKGYIYITDNFGVGAGDGIKFLVYDSNRDLVATSATLDGASIVDGAWNEFTFSSGSITASSTYYLAFIADDSIQIPLDATAGNNLIYDASGSFASPPDPFGSDDQPGGKPGGMYLEK